MWSHFLDYSISLQSILWSSCFTEHFSPQTGNQGALALASWSDSLLHHLTPESSRNDRISLSWGDGRGVTRRCDYEKSQSRRWSALCRDWLSDFLTPWCSFLDGIHSPWCLFTNSRLDRIGQCLSPHHPHNDLTCVFWYVDDDDGLLCGCWSCSWGLLWGKQSNLTLTLTLNITLTLWVMGWSLRRTQKTSDKMVHQNKNIKTKKYKKQLTTLLYTQCIQYTCNTQIMTPLESTYKQCVGRQNVGVPPKQRCPNVAYVRS